MQESEFEEFASNITNFNNGTQSADETVKNIGQIIKNRNLFIQMRTLIYKALAENTFSINSVSQSSIKVKWYLMNLLDYTYCIYDKLFHFYNNYYYNYYYYFLFWIYIYKYINI